MIISSLYVWFRDYLFPRAMGVWELTTLVAHGLSNDNVQKQPLRSGVEELKCFGYTLSAL